jgi:hypothetical protein
VRISVHDTGLGIAPEEQEWVFDEFRRSERSVVRGYSGMGLGLALSRRLIELHGGQIGVTSSGEEEAGSIFYFTLPVYDWPQRWEAKDEIRPVLLLTEYAGEDGYAARTPGAAWLRRKGHWNTRMIRNGCRTSCENYRVQ